MKNKNDYIEAAQQIIVSLGLPRAQQNERSALCLLALLNLTPGKSWADAANPLIGITPIMDWAREHYDKEYAPNTRETVRRQTMHQFCDGGIALYNPDKPDRAVNSPKAVYQIEPAALTLLRTFCSPAWHDSLAAYLAARETLVAKYAKEREQNRIPVEIAPGQRITISPGEHSELIRAIIEDFAPRFAPASVLVYAGDTGDKWGYFDAALLAGLGVDVDSHGKMPDVVLHYAAKNWLLLVESVTSHGPVDGKRHAELADLFAKSTAGLVYVTAFPNRAIMGRYLGCSIWPFSRTFRTPSSVTSGYRTKVNIRSRPSVSENSTGHNGKNIVQRSPWQPWRISIHLHIRAGTRMAARVCRSLKSGKRSASKS